MRVTLLFFGAALLSSLAFAQERNVGTPATVGDITLIRQILEQQSKQIKTLTEQVAILTRMLEERQGIPAGSVTTPAAMDMPPESPSPSSTIAKRSLPVMPATRARQTHTVIKGESFSSIAEKYGVSVDELLQLNPMSDPRKLQIGQTLRLPIMEQQLTPTPSPDVIMTPPADVNAPPPDTAPQPNP